MLVSELGYNFHSSEDLKKRLTISLIRKFVTQFIYLPQHIGPQVKLNGTYS